jgi:hypothetical protein
MAWQGSNRGKRSYEEALGSGSSRWRTLDHLASSAIGGSPAHLVEIDKTDLSVKLQHKMNLISNYFTK